VAGMMKYKGYSARIDHDDDDDGIFAGRIAGIRDGVGFYADDVTTLREAFREAVDDYLEACARAGKVPPKALIRASQRERDMNAKNGMRPRCIPAKSCARFSTNLGCRPMRCRIGALLLAITAGRRCAASAPTGR